MFEPSTAVYVDHSCRIELLGRYTFNTLDTYYKSYSYY